MKKRRSLAAGIVALLERHGHSWPGGADNAILRRTNAGYYQRAAGAWSWYLARRSLDYGPSPDVGGYVPASDVVRRGYRPYIDHHGAIVFDAADPDPRELSTRPEVSNP